MFEFVALFRDALGRALLSVVVTVVALLAARHIWRAMARDCRVLHPSHIVSLVSLLLFALLCMPAGASEEMKDGVARNTEDVRAQEERYRREEAQELMSMVGFKPRKTRFELERVRPPREVVVSDVVYVDAKADIDFLPEASVWKEIGARVIDRGALHDVAVRSFETEEAAAIDLFYALSNGTSQEPKCTARKTKVEWDDDNIARITCAGDCVYAILAGKHSIVGDGNPKDRELAEALFKCCLKKK